MTTALTVTPQPGTASVLLEVEADAASAPTTVLDLDGADVWAERAVWTWTDGQAALGGDATVFTSTIGGATAARALPALTAGLRYRADLTLDTSARSEAQVTVRSGATTRGTLELPRRAGRATYSLEFTAGASAHTLELGLDLSDSQLGIARVRVTSVPTGYDFTLLRSDANGIRPVRLFDGQDVDGGSLIATDYEAALTGPITYTVHTTESVSATTTLALDEAWLTVPVAPQYGQRVPLWPGYREASTPATTVHEVIDRPDPLVTLGVLRTRAGSLELWAPDYPTARALRDVYSRGETVMLRQAAHPGLDLYHVATGPVAVEPHSQPVTVNGQPTHRWRVDVPYVEVNAPSAPLAGALGWTFAQLAARHATFASVAAEFPTFNDLTIGPTS